MNFRHMKPKEYIYYRLPFILTMIFGVIIALIIVFNLGISITLKIVLTVITLTSNTIFVILFYKTSITVNETHILFKYGIGAIKVPIEMNKIKDCVPLETPRVESKGLIAMIKKESYNVLGVKAIEIQFIDKESVLQLETKYPVDICGEVALYKNGGRR